MDAYIKYVPSWVEPPEMEPGSIDPLGYQSQADSIAEYLLPGLTVRTERARYLSFLCWAIRKTDNTPKLIDAWERAYSVCEHLRHRHHDSGDSCRYLGVNKILSEKKLKLKDSDSIPRQLHIQTARVLYKPLMKSVGLIDDKGNLIETGSGKRLADIFGKSAPRQLPRRIGLCRDAFPCLSEIGIAEANIIKSMIFNPENEDGIRRKATLREIGKTFLFNTKGNQTKILKKFLSTTFGSKKASPTALRFHEAALLELEAYPLTYLFHKLYENHGVLPRQKWVGPFRVYEINEEGLLKNVLSHLEMLKNKKRNREGFWGKSSNMTIETIKDYVVQRHYKAKDTAAWIDDKWNQVRFFDKSEPGIHPYRLPAFYSLIKDLGGVR